MISSKNRPISGPYTAVRQKTAIAFSAGLRKPVSPQTDEFFPQKQTPSAISADGVCRFIWKHSLHLFVYFCALRLIDTGDSLLHSLIRRLWNFRQNSQSQEISCCTDPGLNYLTSWRFKSLNPMKTDTTKYPHNTLKHGRNDDKSFDAS